jgi:hypothetical protein
MLVVLLVPVLIGLFLLTMERLEARVFGVHGPRTPSSHVTAPPASSVAPSAAQAHGARRNGNEAVMDRQVSGRRSEGRGPWTYR